MNNPALGPSKYPAIRAWFEAAEATGEFIGIRFGHIAPGATEPNWMFYRHADYDGIGAFAEILRARGIELKQLPQIKYYPAYSALGAALKHWPKYLLPRHPLAWRPHVVEQKGSCDPTQPPRAVAWHVFDEEITQRVRLESRKNGYTVNTLLLKALTDAVRPSLESGQSPIPWMVPVNMRGGVNQYRDSDNHSSYVATYVNFTESAFDIHRKLLKTLSLGQHWGNWHAFKLGRCITHRLRTYLVARGDCISQWNVGAFSNLGEWDPDKRISSSKATGDWLFCPPTLRTQMVAAGCMTYQGRLSLVIQTHPELTTNSDVVWDWMGGWVTAVQGAITTGLKATPGFNKPRAASQTSPVREICPA